jgi:hypothetical protein
MNLIIQKTQNTPYIKFEDGVLVIAGRSIPENALTFFEPVFKAIAEYSKKPFPVTEINILLEYANSSSNRSLMTIFTLFEKLYENGNNVYINWFFEAGDDLMYDLGHDYKAIMRLPFMVLERSSLNI